MFGDFMVYTNRIYISTTSNKDINVRNRSKIGPFVDNDFKWSSMYCHYIAINFFKRDAILIKLEFFSSKCMSEIRLID